MANVMHSSRPSRRAILKGGGALTVGFALAGAPADLLAQAAAGSAARVLDPKEVDAFLAVNSDGTVTIFTGKVDLGQGLRVAIPQMAAEELGIGIDKIDELAHYRSKVELDTMRSLKRALDPKNIMNPGKILRL